VDCIFRADVDGADKIGTAEKVRNFEEEKVVDL
jgi:hypothetical protein